MRCPGDQHSGGPRGVRFHRDDGLGAEHGRRGCHRSNTSRSPMQPTKPAPILGAWLRSADLEPIGSVRRTKVGREATEPMREDIRLLGTILGDTVREQNGEDGVRPRRARPRGVVPGAPLRDRPRRARRPVRRHRHPPGHPGHPRLHPLRAAGQRRRGHPPRAPPGLHVAGGRAAAGQQPGRHLSRSSIRPTWIPRPSPTR